MGRGKLALELIPEEKTRKLTYERRKKCLLKKAQELSTLCGVDTCMVIYESGSSSSSATAQPEIWPPNHEEVRRVIERYQNGCSQTRAKRSSGLQEFFENRTRKVESELQKIRKDTWDAKYNISDEQLKSLSGDNLRDLLGTLQRKLDSAKTRLAYLKEKENEKNYPGDRTVAAPIQSTMPMMGNSCGRLSMLSHSHSLPVPPALSMLASSFGYPPGPHSYNLPLPPVPSTMPMMGDSFGYPPVPHSYDMPLAPVPSTMPRMGDFFGYQPVPHSYNMPLPDDVLSTTPTMGDSFGYLPVPRSYDMPLPPRPSTTPTMGDSFGYPPVPHSYDMPCPPVLPTITAMGDSSGYQPLPHTCGLQMQQQGLPDQLPGIFLGGGAESRHTYSGQEGTHEVGTWKTNCPISTNEAGGFLAEHNDGSPEPWMSFDLEDDFFLPGLLEGDDLQIPL